MRQYAWYSPELDVIIFQTIMEDCYISFEWDWFDMNAVMTVDGKFNGEIKPIEQGTWIPLGEL